VSIEMADLLRGTMISIASFLIGGVVSVLFQQWHQRDWVAPPRLPFYVLALAALAYISLLLVVIGGRWSNIGEPLGASTVAAVAALVLNLAVIVLIVIHGRPPYHGPYTRRGDPPDSNG
jgi:peptidoglycan/LPS O-acetylase OafA/YrhL